MENFGNFPYSPINQPAIYSSHPLSWTQVESWRRFWGQDGERQWKLQLLPKIYSQVDISKSYSMSTSPGLSSEAKTEFKSVFKVLSWKHDQNTWKMFNSLPQKTYDLTKGFLKSGDRLKIASPITKVETEFSCSSDSLPPPPFEFPASRTFKLKSWKCIKFFK